MTKIAYLRASQSLASLAQQQNSPNCASALPSNCPPSPPRMVQCYQPPPPMMMMNQGPVMQFSTPRPGAQFTPNGGGRPHSHVPAPKLATPTTRFNSNPSVVMCDPNGGKISKPLMEKKRRARINQCLSQLKMIVVDSAGEQTQKNKCKLEKADILELTVKYVKKLHQSYMDSVSPNADTPQPYLNGYYDCVQQVNSFMADMHSSNVAPVQEMLSSYLNQCLLNFQQSGTTPGQSTSLFCTPPSPAPSSESCLSNSPTSGPVVGSLMVVNPITMATSHTQHNSPSISMHSLGSSDYDEDDSDSDCEDHPEHPTKRQRTDSSSYSNGELPLNLKINNNPMDEDDEDVWRPW